MKRNIIFGILIILLLLVTGCTTQTGDDSSNVSMDESTTHEVDLVVTSIEFNGILYPLYNNKVPQPNNFELNIRETDYNEGELYTLLSNKKTVGVLSNVNVGRAYLEGEEYKILSTYYREIVSPNGDTMGKLVTSIDSSINSPEDLVGKTVGIQGSADGSTIAMMTALRKIYNVDLDSITFEIVESNMAPILVEEGRLDAAMFDSDYILTEDYDTKYKTVFDFNRDLYDFYGTVPPAAFFVVRKDMYDENPDLYKDIISYLKENYEWYRNNVEEVSRAEAEQSGEPYELILMKADYEARAEEMTERDIAAFNDFYETAIERGIIDEVPDLNQIFIR